MRIRTLLLLAALAVSALPAGAARAEEAADLSLADAARNGDRAAVQALLGNHASPDVADPDGTTALIWAAGHNDLAMAALLLGAGADVMAANEYGATALYAAAAADAEAAMIERLLAAGADPNAHLLSGETALMEAARQGNLATVHALMEGHADPNAQEMNGGQNALMWAISERHAAVTEELVRRGADIAARSKAGFTPLMFAAQQGDTDSARILLAAGASPNEVMPRTGLTPLLLASAMGRAKVAALLLDHSADPDAVAASGFSALHYAARRRGAAAVTIIAALIKHGAKPNVRLNQKKPSETPNGVVLQGATPLALAADINNIESVKALIDGGADPLIPTTLGTTPLMLAAGAGTDVVRSRSPAERTVAIATVKLLVEHGSDVNAAGQFGWTALHSATYQGLNDVIAFLVGKGAKLDVKDGFGQTPLSISNTIITKEVSSHGYQAPRIFRRDTAELLLRLGATPLEQSGVVGVVQRVLTE
jgi:ankyrin repeat protein